MTKIANAKLTGVKALCTATKSLTRSGYGAGYEVFVNRKTGRVWGNYQVSTSTWTEYDNPDVIRCGWIDRPVTMACIAAIVRDAVIYRGSLAS